MTMIVICTTQRSGSTMVCEDMARFGLGKPDEYFLPWIERDNLNWKHELQTMMEAQTENGLFAVKVMANQVRRIDLKLAECFPAVDGKPFPHFRAAFPHAEWVFIQRKDTIDQAISHFLAKRSGVYHVVSNREGFVPGAAFQQSVAEEKIAEVSYNFDALLSEWHTLQVGNLLWREFFSETGIEPLRIEYETYEPDALSQVGNRLGIIRKEPDGVRNLNKMPNARNLEMKKRFKEDLFSRL